MEEYYTQSVNILEKEEGDYVVWYFNVEGRYYFTNDFWDWEVHKHKYIIIFVIRPTVKVFAISVIISYSNFPPVNDFQPIVSR